MKQLGVAAAAVFLLAFVGVYAYNNGAAEPFVLVTPYHAGEGLATHLAALLFVFVFSLLFFGFSAPIATGLEGARFASLLATGTGSYYDLLFAVPEVAAAYSAAMLGPPLLEDFKAKENVFKDWEEAKKFAVFSVAAFVVLAVVGTLI